MSGSDSWFNQSAEHRAFELWSLIIELGDKEQIYALWALLAAHLIFHSVIRWFSGWFARDPAILHRVGHALLQLNAVEPKRTRCLIFADDLFQLSKVPRQKTDYVIRKAIENLCGCKLQGFFFFFFFILGLLYSCIALLVWLAVISWLE